MTDDDPLFWWRLAPDLSVEDAAILITGGNPADRESVFNGADFEMVKKTLGHPNFAPAFSALKAAIANGQLKARLAYAVEKINWEGDRSGPNCWIVTGEDMGRLFSGLDDDPFFERELAKIGLTTGTVKVTREPDWSRSMVDVEDLKGWLRSRGFARGFFFPTMQGESDNVLDETHDHFAPELALAVAAWRALSNRQSFIGGVKAAIVDWIERNPSAWKGDGRPSDNAKERVATLINWKPKGGAPTTGG